MIQVYTGNGKGKTTAAVGLGLRAVGAGKKVLLIQFLKDGQSSEIKAIKKISNFDIRVFGRKGFIKKDNLKKIDYDLAQQGFSFFQKAIKDKKYDCIILDEINVVSYFNLIDKKDLIDLIKKTPKKIEVVLTGRKASKEIIKIADLVTEMKEIKHYFKKIRARKGIEY